MLTALDIVTLLLIAGAAVMGVLRGFVTEVLSLSAWAAAIVAVKFLHAPVTAMLTGVIGTPSGAAMLAFALIFLITFFAGKMTAVAIGRRTRQSVLGPVDRVLGLGFGALKGLLAATMLFLVANFGYDTMYGSVHPRPEWMTNSRTYPLLNASGRAVVDYVDKRRKAKAATDVPADNATDAAGNQS